MSTCGNCKSWVPDGRSLCDAHYEEALREFDEDYAVYQQNCRWWADLSPEEQQAESWAAEKSSLKIWIFIFGIVLGVLYSVLEKDSPNFEWWIGAAIPLLTLFMPKPVLMIIGKPFRFVCMQLFGSAMYTFIIYASGWFLGVVLLFISVPTAESLFALLKDPDTILGLPVIVFVFYNCLIIFLIVFKGDMGYEDTGKPQPPTRPTP
jgi:hypothetical protein|tara:strand:+ start:132 stop:749 length:618 start_codon:yes stop_codon:yes gene_type:complete